MVPLTSATWTGLPLFACRDKRRVIDWRIEVPEPTLVLWLNSGTVLDIRRNSRQLWSFRTRANHFDLYAPGAYEAVLADDSARDALILTLPRNLMSALLPDTDRDFAFEHCRFQFADLALKKMLLALADQASQGEPLGPLFTQSLSAAIVDRLTSNVRRESSGRTGTASLSAVTRRLLLSLFEGQIVGTGLRVDKIALISGMGTADFLRAFRSTFGMTPLQFSLEYRILRAKSMLSDDKSLTEVALELGFASHAHFSATFRARTGHTPSGYRRQSDSPLSTKVDPFLEIDKKRA